MHFKEIELAGFKSFADRLQIKFDEGITAIVGPNGCGKSNVADAIRWVLGEQSSKQLRGTSMQDVIFNGTKKRKCLSYCEASLTFNNQDRFFNTDYDEICVTRKLYRSGESEYLINKQPVRLKDIIDLFYDSGIGRDGYSIIGQGKVEEIISSKPEDRRIIFEEAAGIAKFKSRKVEAQRKLDRTNDNLTRLRDILFELENQLGPLKKQAEIAKKYLELKATLKDNEINAYIYQFENASNTKNEINEKLNGINEQLSLREKDYELVNADYDKNMNEINQIDSKINLLHQRILTLTVQIEKQSGEAKLIKERIAYLNEQNARIENDLTNEKIQIKNYNEQKLSKENRIEEISKLTNELNAKTQTLLGELLAVSNDLDLIEGQAHESTKSILNSVEKITDIKSTVSSLKAEKDLLATSKAELVEKNKLLDAKIEESNKNKKALIDEISSSNLQLQAFSRQNADLSFKLTTLNSNLLDQNQNRTNLFAKLQVYENRKRLLSEMQAEFEGYIQSVKRLLKESERNSEIKNKIVGVLASLIKVPQAYETAIEVALGNAVQNIVTFDEQGAKDLINHLKANEYGRATFLPITTMRPRILSNEEYNASKIQGSYGIASDLISFDEKIRNVVENLLGATIVVNNLDTAIALANKTRYGVKIVTLDGDVVNPQGSFTGGSRKNDSVNLIAREREIETLSKEIEKIKIDLENANNEVKNLGMSIQNTQKQMQDVAIIKGQSEVVLAKQNEKLENIDSLTQTDISEKLENQKKLSILEMKVEDIDLNLKRLSDLEKGSVVNSDEYNQIDKERIEKTNVLRQKRDSMSSELTSIKVQLASLETEKTSHQDDIVRIGSDIVSTQIILESNQNLLEKNKQVIEGANEILLQSINQTANQKLLGDLENAKSEQVKLSQSKVDMQNEVTKINDKRNVLLDEISSLKEKKFAKESELAKVDTDIEAMKQRIFEEYELTYETCLPLKKPDFDVNFGIGEINRLKREINKLGYVNVNAIEDSKTILERYEMLSTQEQDLLKAASDLTTIIDDLSKEMETKFKTEFDKINENFKITFQELFGGGSASLQLVESDNILEAGVDIIAEPPGKSLRSISLLSGGEKALTAIAILFAILRMRPMPFCLLDEIEAALDEANVERFAQYLRKFSQTTQFIVITHRKPTMELADSLYGVTMEEEGVSTMVSVKLSDAIKNSKEVAV